MHEMIRYTAKPVMSMPKRNFTLSSVKKDFGFAEFFTFFPDFLGLSSFTFDMTCLKKCTPKVIKIIKGIRHPY